MEITISGENNYDDDCKNDNNLDYDYPLVGFTWDRIDGVKMSHLLTNDKTILMSACSKRPMNVQDINILLNTLEENINAQYKNTGNTALIYACNNTSAPIEVISRLLQAGSDPCIRGSFGQNSLICACDNPAVTTEMIKMLLSHGASSVIHELDLTENNAIMFLCTNHSINIQMIKALIDAGSDITQIETNGKNALMLACANRNINIEIIYLLLNVMDNKKNELMVKVRDVNGDTAMDHLINNPKHTSEMIQALLKYGALKFNLLDN